MKVALQRWLMRRGWMRCQHLAREEHAEWREYDGTLMLAIRCPDCGYLDIGHVYE